MGERYVAIPEQVFDELLPMAEQEDRDVSDLVSEALRQYLWHAKEQKIDDEMEAYRAMHAELKQRFLGEYVAIHDGQVVDRDADRNLLSRRVRQRYGSIAVLITPVEETPEREFVIRSPRFERGA